ncbi:MAG: metal-dependent transcriptional regulator [Deltaproteobacteria bacterium]|nr:metal-dependent transcriptional regulator [Deltaproteobacteria bacterium]
MDRDKAAEEVLEFIWSEREAGKNSVTDLIRIKEVADADADLHTLVEMQERGLLKIDGDRVTLTSEGDRLAEAAIRRHRLAERLLSEVLAMSEDNLEENACSFEHTLSPEVTESICTLLGHPPTCPHGLPIPRGECCKKTKDDLRPIVQPIDEISVGSNARIIFIASKSHARLDRFGTLGIVPGSVVRVHQKRPAFVIQIGETTLALDPEIVREIFVKRVG